MRRILLAVALLSTAMLSQAVAQTNYGAPRTTGLRVVAPQDRAENRVIPMNGNLPACEDPSVLGQISGSFGAREFKFWGPLEVVAFDRVQPLAYRPWGEDFIPRRFCTGRVALNDGSLHRVDYSVRENLGIFGITWNVNWCVSGLDRHRSYAPDCKMARP